MNDNTIRPHVVNIRNDGRIDHIGALEHLLLAIALHRKKTSNVTIILVLTLS